MQRGSVVAIGVLIGMLAIGWYFLGRDERAATSDIDVAAALQPAIEGIDKPPAARVSTSASTAVASAPLPPNGTPLSKIHDDLAARARAGDNAAALRLVADLQLCMRSKTFQESIALNLESLRTKVKDVDLDRVARVMVELEQRSEFLEVVCEGATDRMIEDRGEWLLLAVGRGDPEAMACFAGFPRAFAPPFLSDAWFIWAARWRDEAVPLALRAYALGNKEVLPLLADAYSGGVDKGFSFPGTSELANLVEQDLVRAALYAELARSKGLLPDHMAAWYSEQLDETGRATVAALVARERPRFENARDDFSSCIGAALW